MDWSRKSQDSYTLSLDKISGDMKHQREEEVGVPLEKERIYRKEEIYHFIKYITFQCIYRMIGVLYKLYKLLELIEYTESRKIPEHTKY